VPNNEGLDVRTKRLALRIIRLVGTLPKTYSAEVIGKQLVRSGTSVGAHYREGHFARSPAEFISKLGVAIQEMAESQYWIELLVEAEFVSAKKLVELGQEMKEILAMLVASVRTAKRKRG
jgi:four helix bundle protein